MARIALYVESNIGLDRVPTNFILGGHKLRLEREWKRR